MPYPDSDRIKTYVGIFPDCEGCSTSVTGSTEDDKFEFATNTGGDEEGVKLLQLRSDGALLQGAQGTREEAVEQAHRGRRDQ